MSLSDDFALIKQNLIFKYHEGGSADRMELLANRLKNTLREIYPEVGEEYDPSAKMIIEEDLELEPGTLQMV